MAAVENISFPGSHSELSWAKALFLEWVQKKAKMVSWGVGLSAFKPFAFLPIKPFTSPNQVFSKQRHTLLEGSRLFSATPVFATSLFEGVKRYLHLLLGCHRASNDGHTIELVIGMLRKKKEKLQTDRTSSRLLRGTA